jgi:hypothetical protein
MPKKLRRKKKQEGEEEERTRRDHPIPTTTGHESKRGIFSLSFFHRFRTPRRE